jgi:hypothetical protein
MGIKERLLERRKGIIPHRAASFEDADHWDLLFWRNQTPEQRLSALVAIHGDIMAVEQGRKGKHGAKKPGD